MSLRARLLVVLAGLELGDDYVTKPFTLAELIARVRAVLRRTRGAEERQLRFARVLRHRPDKRPEEADTLDAVLAIHRKP